MWKAEYLSLRAPAQHLRIWVMYHNAKCWQRLERGPLYGFLRLAGPLRSAEDVDAVAIEGRGADPVFQTALGEFLGMIALARTPEVLKARPFVGFASWRWREKEDWMEGASLDWTKVDFTSGRTVYYWCGLVPRAPLFDQQANGQRDSWAAQRDSAQLSAFTIQRRSKTRASAQPCAR